ncbi:MAG TPA: UDP-N-acetylglucosamine 1-carboxyvinyltransferase [Nitrospirae bacterium]|nr:UDP-N-acetylglucosamine 1-carboxyvinyltransferase [Nitrospirota bacterium]
MDQLLITGGRPLKGAVKVSGAKNATLPAMAATVLTEGRHIIRNVPLLRDVKTMDRLLVHMGMDVRFENSTMIITNRGVRNFEAPYDLVKTMRASILVLGPMIARYGRARVSLPGGCAIGARPVNLHLMGLEKMGARIELNQGYIEARASRLHGADIYFDIPTVTGTENLMMAASLAKGVTRIENAAREPEVVDLAEALNNMGARIYGAGESIINIEGVDELNPLNHTVIPDRIETGTFIVAAAITGGEIEILNARAEHLEAVITKLEETGVACDTSARGLRAYKRSPIQARDLKTMPYPGFPTDMQAQFMALMCLAEGTSVIRETIFENRFMHVAELKRMGADITIEGSIATVKGVKALKGAPVMATDLRASASLVLAGLAAEGETLVDRIYHLDRGYERLDDKLKTLGARIERIKR